MSNPYITSVERQGIQKGIQQGIEQGIEQGFQQGETTLLQKLLQRRFGPLPDWVAPRLATASPTQLEHWAERLLEVDSLVAVFGDD